MCWAAGPRGSSGMSRILVHVEGQTEETFVNRILAPHLYMVGYTLVSARLLGNARQRSRRGGIRPWGSVRNEVLNHLTADQDAFATTLVDYYGLPDTWPGRKQAGSHRTPEERAATVEQAVLEDISESLGGSFDPQRFVPYVVMHEFEGLLFSDPERFARGIGMPNLSSEFQAIRDDFDTPEEINDSPENPSFRAGRGAVRGLSEAVDGRPWPQGRLVSTPFARSVRSSADGWRSLSRGLGCSVGIWPGDALAQPSPVERPHLPGFPPPRERRVVASQPNIVFLFPDQLRRDFLSCYGAGDSSRRPTRCRPATTSDERAGIGATRRTRRRRLWSATTTTRLRENT